MHIFSLINAYFFSLKEQRKFPSRKNKLFEKISIHSIKQKKFFKKIRENKTFSKNHTEVLLNLICPQFIVSKNKKNFLKKKEAVF